MRRLPAPAGFDAMTRAPCEPVAAGTGLRWAGRRLQAAVAGWTKRPRAAAYLKEGKHE